MEKIFFEIYHIILIIIDFDLFYITQLNKCNIKVQIEDSNSITI